MRKNPIEVSATMLDSVLADSRETPYLLVANSGGKDACATAQLCGEALQRWNATHPKTPGTMRFFYKYLVENIECIEKPIHFLRRRFNVPHLYSFPSPILSRALKVGFMREVTLNTLDTVNVQENDIEWAARMTMAADLSGIAPENFWRFVEDGECPTCEGRCTAEVRGFEHLIPQELLLSGGRMKCFDCKGKGRKFKRLPSFSKDDIKIDPHRIWVCSGHRQSDSLDRRAWLSSMATGSGRNNPWRGGYSSGVIGLDKKGYRAYPIAEWSTRDVLSFNQYRNIPPPAQLGKANQGGLDLSEKCMLWLWAHARADYWRVLEVFPHAHAHVAARGLDQEAMPSSKSA